MSSGQNGQGFKQCLKLAALLVTALVVAGCSSSSLRSIQTWDGPSAQAGQVAILEKPESIKILSVNGREVNSYLMDDIELRYELLPGQNTVAFTYKTVWANQRSSQDEGSKVNVIETDPLQVVINAQAGRTYQFVVPKASSQREAERMAQNMQIRVVDEQNRQVAVSGDYVAPKPQLPQLPQAPASDTAQTVAPAATAGAAVGAAAASSSGSAPAVPSAAEGLPTLEGLKLLWERASKEEKKNFLRWAFQ